MPVPIVLFAILFAALLGNIRAASAQSAYSYPWCSVRNRGAMSCYYTSWEQCRASLSGIGGNCVNSPYYRPSAPPAPRIAKHRK
jgi:hypothetical protein